jgi:hypothetical protein
VVQARRGPPSTPLRFRRVEHDGLREPSEISQVLIRARYGRHRHERRRLSHLPRGIEHVRAGMPPNPSHGSQEVMVIVAHLDRVFVVCFLLESGRVQELLPAVCRRGLSDQQALEVA